MAIGSLVRSTTVDLSSTSTVVPFAAKAVFAVFHYIHRAWRWIRLGKIYSNPNNFAMIAAGHGTNFAFGDSLLVKLSAISVLIATRILHSVTAYEKLLNAWGKMYEAFHNEYPVPIKVDWNQETHNRFFSLSSIIWIKTTTKEAIQRVKRIALTLFQVTKRAFFLSMRLVDAIEAFSLNPNVRHEAINLLYVNSSTCVSKLVDNKELLLERLESNRGVIKKVLTGIGSPITTNQLTKSVRSTLEKTASAHKSVKTVNEAVGEFVTSCGKKWTYEFFREIGLRHMVPQTLIPSAVPPWEERQKKKIKVRFIPKKLITMPPEPSKPKPRKTSKHQGMSPLKTGAFRLNIPGFVKIKIPSNPRK